MKRYQHRSKLEKIRDFLQLINIRGKRECWLWQGKIDVDGYGSYRGFGTNTKAHRIAMGLHLGRELVSPTRQLNKGEVARHSCDNRACCNPFHILLGTQLDNIRDREARGKTSKGEGRPASKLKEEDIRQIRKLFQKIPKGTPRWKGWDYGASGLGRRFGVDASVIQQIVDGRIWKHVK